MPFRRQATQIWQFVVTNPPVRSVRSQAVAVLFAFAVLASAIGYAVFTTGDGRRGMVIDQIMLGLTLVGVLVSLLSYAAGLPARERGDSSSSGERSASTADFAITEESGAGITVSSLRSLNAILFVAALCLVATAVLRGLSIIRGEALWPVDGFSIGVWLVPAAIAAIGFGEVVASGDLARENDLARQAWLSRFEAVILVAITFMAVEIWARALGAF